MSWGGFRRTWSLGDAKSKHNRTQANLITVGEPMRSRHAVPRYVRAVLAPEILEYCCAFANDYARVVTGNA